MENEFLQNTGKGLPISASNSSLKDLDSPYGLVATDKRERAQVIFQQMKETNSHRALLMVVDCFTRWGWVFPLENKSRDCLFIKLLPLLVDQGFDCLQGIDPLLLDEEFQEYLGNSDIDLDFSDPSIAESQINVLLQSLNKRDSSNLNWDEYVDEMMHFSNTSVNSAIQTTPFFAENGIHYIHYSQILALHAISPLIVLDEEQTRDMVVKNILSQNPQLAKTPKKEETEVKVAHLENSPKKRPQSPTKTSPKRSPKKKIEDPNKKPSKWKEFTHLQEQATGNPDTPRSLRSKKNIL